MRAIKLPRDVEGRNASKNLIGCCPRFERVFLPESRFANIYAGWRSRWVECGQVAVIPALRAVVVDAATNTAPPFVSSVDG